MRTKEPIALRLPLELVKALRAVKERQGIPVTTQIEFAYREWLNRRGLNLKGERKTANRRAQTRRKA